MLFSSSIEYFAESKLATSGILQILVYDPLDNWIKSILKIKNRISKNLPSFSDFILQTCILAIGWLFRATFFQASCLLCYCSCWMELLPIRVLSNSPVFPQT